MACEVEVKSKSKMTWLGERRGGLRAANLNPQKAIKQALSIAIYKTPHDPLF